MIESAAVGIPVCFFALVYIREPAALPMQLLLEWRIKSESHTRQHIHVYGDMKLQENALRQTCTHKRSRSNHKILHFSKTMSWRAEEKERRALRNS